MFILDRERQERKQEETRNAILDAARNIISNEGIVGLSIRKITNTIGYSPGIIYHYFKNKDEIVKALTSEGYRQILNEIGTVKKNENEPEEEMKEVFTNYIRAALSSPEVYKAFMLNEDSAVLEKSSLLKKGISKKSQTMQMLCANLQKGIEKSRYVPHYDPELTAQIIWTSTFGLIIKLIIEKNVSEEQINRLIDYHFKVLFHGILNEKFN